MPRANPRPKDSVRDGDRSYGIIDPERLFPYARHGIEPLRGSRDYGCQYRLRQDGVLVLERVRVELVVASAPAVLGVQPAFPYWSPEHGDTGAAIYDFAPGQLVVDGPTTLILGDDYDESLEVSTWRLDLGLPTRTTKAFAHRIVRELRFDRAPIERERDDAAPNVSFRTAPAIGVRLVETIDHSELFEQLRQTLGSNRLDRKRHDAWMKRFELEAMKLPAPFTARLMTKAEKDNPFGFERMGAMIDDLERDAEKS